jgi:hypothetical protein
VEEGMICFSVSVVYVRGGNQKACYRGGGDGFFFFLFFQTLFKFNDVIVLVFEIAFKNHYFKGFCYLIDDMLSSKPFILKEKSGFMKLYVIKYPKNSRGS